MPKDIPLSECSGQEILARVAYRIILADYHINPEQYDNAASRLFWLALVWKQAGLELLGATLHDAASQVASGSTIASWKAASLSYGRVSHLAVARLDRSRRR